MSRTALLTGITGQNGSYLAESILAKDDKMHGGVVRRLTGLSEGIEQTFSWFFDQPHFRGA